MPIRNVPVSPKRWAGCLWPGGAHLWRRGSWPALALALAFSVLLNLLLVASMVWKEWLPPDVLAAGWLAAATVWIGSAWASWRMLATETNGDADGSAREKLFREAQTQYLQGNWFEAESALNTLLKQDRRDIEARLMRATLWRHTHRSEDSLKEVEMLSRMESAGKWEQELQHLRTTLTQRDAEAVDAA